MNTEKEPLRVIGLRAQNVMALRAIAYQPDPNGSLVIVGGDNGAGKTSTLDCIFWALTGKPSAKQPIRNGEAGAEMEVDLGDSTGLKIKALRKFWRNASTGKLETSLKLSNPEGAIYQRPQQMLDDLLTQVSIDPFDFTRKKPAEQLSLIRSGLNLDTSDLDKQESEAKEKRKDLHKELERVRIRNAGLTTHPDVPTEELSLETLQAELAEANANNDLIRDARNAAASYLASKLTAGQEAISRQESHIEDLEEQLRTARVRLDSMRVQFADWEKEHAALDAKVHTLGAPIVTSAILDKINDANDINRKVRENLQRATAQAEWHELEAQRVEVEKQIQSLDATRKALTLEAVKAAKLAVDGLELREDGPYLKGIPFEQCNTAEQLKLSVALAVHENPRIRVFRIADGEKLTPKNMAILGEIAAEAQAQIWVEFAVTPQDVAKGYREVSILIEDGEMIAVPAVVEPENTIKLLEEATV